MNIIMLGAICKSVQFINRAAHFVNGRLFFHQGRIEPPKAARGHATPVHPV